MTKTAERVVTLGTTDFTVKCEKTLLEIEGDIWEDRVGETICTKETKIYFTVNGKDFSGTLDVVDYKNPCYKRFIETGSYGCIFGTPVGLKKESYNQLAKAVAEAEKEADFEEYADYVNTENAEKAEAERKSAEHIIAKAEKEIKAHGKLMTAKEIRVWNENYNNVMNEGGEGYIPSHVSQEEYERAKKVIARGE